MPDALPATTIPIYPGLGQAQEYAGLHTPWLGLVAVVIMVGIVVVVVVVVVVGGSSGSCRVVSR